MITDALVVQEPGAAWTYQQISIEDNLRDDEVLVEIKATGVCHTDLNFAAEKTMPGLFPGVFGHEGGGVVVKTGQKVTSTSPGDHVILAFACCGDCKHCNSNASSYCYDFERANFGVGRADGSKAYSGADGSRINSHFFGQSSFSKFAIVVATCVVKVDPSLPLEDLAPLSCGFLTGAGAMLNVVAPTADDVVCIVGAGAVGLAALMALKMCPTPPRKVIAVDIVPERLQLAKKYGATVLINSREVKDLKTALLDATDGEGVDGTIDTTGRAPLVGELLKATAKKGKVIQVGLGQLDAEVSANILETITSGRQYIGCANGNCLPQDFVPKLIEAWQNGNFPFTDLAVKYPARDMDLAAKDVLSGKVVKAVLMWD
ncbi:hypothetical protein LZ554_004096 [Drepanopeziza brunnea f. sp. 'monogermtubi']|nr:hypothetical protein LZ554_004096 [Drepanopeziza brunnea f. sp. 'monogermtubi']